MKKALQILAVLTIIVSLISCNNSTQTPANASSADANSDAGQANVKDDASMKDIVKVAVGSPDHTTLVSALKQADLVDVLANPGPFTVFAPTNEAFNKLPKGTLDDLMKTEKKADLQNILQYHVTTSSLKADYFKDGHHRNGERRQCDSKCKGRKNNTEQFGRYCRFSAGFEWHGAYY
jgi:uncharacterized surface protein with fasciclin (FAS1) repeats